MRMDQTITVNAEDELRLDYVREALIITRRSPSGQMDTIVIEGRDDQLEIVLDRLKRAYLDELSLREVAVSDSELAEAQRMEAMIEEASASTTPD